MYALTRREVGRLSRVWGVRVTTGTLSSVTDVVCYIDIRHPRTDRRDPAAYLAEVLAECAAAIGRPLPPATRTEPEGVCPVYGYTVIGMSRWQMRVWG